MIKAILLITSVSIMSIWILAMTNFNVSGLLQNAIDTSAAQGSKGELLLHPMQKWTDAASFLSLSIALVFGTSGLPHVLMRFYTVPTAKEARRSVTWAIALIGGFYLMTLILGYAAAWLVGPEKISRLPGKSNAATPALAYELGGEVLMAVIAGIDFATILAVVAGLTITASASFAHNIYNSVMHDGKATP